MEIKQNQVAETQEKLIDLEKRIITIESNKRSIKRKIFNFLFLIIGIASISIIGTTFAKLAWNANTDVTIGGYFFNPTYLFLNFVLLVSLVLYSGYKNRSKFSNFFIRRYLFKLLSVFLMIFFSVPIAYYLWRTAEVYAGKLSPIDKTDFSTLVNIFIPILAAVGLGIYVWISKELKEQNKSLMKGERKASHAEVCKVLSYTLGAIYAESKGKGKFKNFLDKALEFDEKGFRLIDCLDKEEYGEIILDIKNNYAYNLANLQKRDQQNIGRKRALKIKEELWEMRESGNLNKYKEPSIL